MTMEDLKAFVRHLLFESRPQVSLGLENLRRPSYVLNVFILLFAIALITRRNTLIFSAVGLMAAAWLWKKWVAGEWRKKAEV